MRTALLTIASLACLGIAAFVGARPADLTAAVRVRLVDAASGEPVAGIVRIAEDGDSRMPPEGGTTNGGIGAGKQATLALPGLFDRMRGLDRSPASTGWHVVGKEGAEIVLPRKALRIEALSGLETELVRTRIDLATRPQAEVVVKLPFLFRPAEHSLVAGNTHLHLRNLTAEQCDDYLRQIPAADGLKVLFVSYLDRPAQNQQYISNRYPIGDLAQFNRTGVLINNGEEHRNNFLAFGEGYGHVMLLDIRRLIEPVSIGPGITGSGNDDTPLKPGMEEARRQNGTVIWCHNTQGHEDVPSALAGRLDALNVFDGSRNGDYEENYYRFLNIGLRMPISTGTDWFMYDFSRVYARVTGTLTIKSWLAAVKAGRTVATNGPLLTLTVDGKPIGETVSLSKAGPVRIEAAGIGRHDFQRLQLVQNGRVIATELAKRSGGRWTARFEQEVRVDGPAWFAVRIDSQTKNELDRQLYAHTSPVYVEVAGRKIFDLEAADGLLRQLERSKSEIKARGRFSGPDAQSRVFALYDAAIADLTSRINRRGG